MKTRTLLSIIIAISLLATFSSGYIHAQTQPPVQGTSVEAALDSSFTYQGQLSFGDQPANGSYDFEFQLFASASGGSPIASLFKEDVSVLEGLLSVELDFGTEAFQGGQRWMQISVRPGSNTGNYSPLSPRQKITAAPNALYAHLAGSVPWTGLTGIPPGFADGVDDDTSHTAGSGLNLSGTEFSIDSAYRLPQTCSDGQVAEWNNSLSVWECATDDDTDTTYTAGSGLSLTGTEFRTDFAGSGSASTSARSDHDHAGVYASSSHAHDDRYYTETELQTSGSAIVHWDNLSSVPAGFADGVDNDTDTTYTAGTGLSLIGTDFSVDTSSIQARVSGTCAVGSTIRVINADGSVECQVDVTGERSTMPAETVTNTLDGSGDDVGRYTSATIGTDGLGLISYYDVTNGDLMVAHCSDVNCSSATTTTLDSSGNVGQYTSIIIGADGLGLISYYDATNGDLKVAHCSDIACTIAAITTLDSTSNVGQYTSIIIGTDSFGLISYYDISNDNLKVAHCTNQACSNADLTTLDTGAGLYTSLIIGVDGLGLISYYDTGGGLKVAHCANTACTSTTKITGIDGNPKGQYNSITLGIDGLGLISYYDGVSRLKVAHCENVECGAVTKNDIDVTGNVGWYTSITIGTDDMGLISYYDSGNGDLKVAHCNDINCTKVTLNTLVSVDDVGQYTGITIGADGLPLISYYDVSNGDLKVAHCSNEFCVPYFRRR